MDEITELCKLYNGDLYNGNTTESTILKYYEDYYKQSKQSINVDINRVIVLKRTLFIFASYYGHIRVIKQLIKDGVDINTVDFNECTPLHYAIEKGNTDVVKLLIKNGANVNVIDNNGMSLLHNVIKKGNMHIIHIIKLLLDKLMFD